MGHSFGLVSDSGTDLGESRLAPLIVMVANFATHKQAKVGSSLNFALIAKISYC